jgi:Zn-dependent M28 family amino/carboxypeptidase
MYHSNMDFSISGKVNIALFAALLLLFGSSCLDTSAQTGRVDAEHLMQHVEKMVSYGPHPPGSQAQKKVGSYIAEQLESSGLEVHTHTFDPVTPLGRREMTNIWGVVEGKEDSVIILASHYDSKYFEDFSFLGANDSGSSSGLLLELARILKQENPTDYSLWFVFFDGEEAFFDWTSADSLYGSREFVRMLKGRDQLRKISALILLDMVGEKDLVLRKDFNSTPWLNQIIWDQAATMGYGDIFQSRGNTGAQDDHLPFAREGIPVVDIIDLNYAYWHKKEDTLDKLSPDNLRIVGDVVVASLPAIAKHLKETP